MKAEETVRLVECTVVHLDPDHPRVLQRTRTMLARPHGVQELERWALEQLTDPPPAEARRHLQVIVRILQSWPRRSAEPGGEETAREGIPIASPGDWPRPRVDRYQGEKS